MLMNVNPSRICAIHYELIALTPWDLTTVVANQATKEMASVVYVGECDLLTNRTCIGQISQVDHYSIQ